MDESIVHGRRVDRQIRRQSAALQLSCSVASASGPASRRRPSVLSTPQKRPLSDATSSPFKEQSPAAALPLTVQEDLLASWAAPPTLVVDDDSEDENERLQDDEVSSDDNEQPPKNGLENLF